MRYILAIQVLSFFTLGTAFLLAGNPKLGLAQLCFGIGTAILYA